MVMRRHRQVIVKSTPLTVNGAPQYATMLD